MRAYADRWWRDTSGTDKPEWVLWHSFEPGVASFGLDGVITEAGLAVFGPDFARLGPAERSRVIQGLLAERRLLLIWDNFETVRSMPDPAGATAPLDEAECAKVQGFLGRLAAGGRSAVVITSRTTEDWLGPIHRIEVGGLAREEAAQYAGQLLAPYPAAAPRRDQRAFGELLEWLDGHPLSMRLILPRLDSTEPEAVLEGLRGTTPLPGGDQGEDRGTSLAASITYSFTHLGGVTRWLLPAVCLFHGVADGITLVVLSGEPGVPGRFAGASVQAWMQALEDAARVGLLTPLRLGDGLYWIHPALPSYLAARWRTEDPEGYDSSRDATTRALVSSYAALGSELYEAISSGDAGVAYAVIRLQRRNFGALLGYALDHQLWEQAGELAYPLNSYWNGRGLDDEASAWTDRVQLATEDPHGKPPRLDTPRGALWLFITVEQAGRQQQAMHLDDAEHTYHEILDMLQAQSTSPRQQDHVAAVYLRLGEVARDRGRLEDAEDWYRKSLAIHEDLRNRPAIADSYHQLGNVAQYQRRLEEAEDWYYKSLAIRKKLGNLPGTADSYHQLGNVAQYQGRLEDAEDWYRKSLAIKEHLGNRPPIGPTYHELGVVAYRRGRLEEAEDWYRKSLAIWEDIGNRPRIASSYRSLGMLAQRQGWLEDAEDWYRKSLAIDEELENRPSLASTYGQLGLLAEQRDQPRQALEWMVRCVALFGQFPHPLTGPGPEHLTRLTAQLGIDALESSWREVTGDPLPQVVRDYVSSRRLK